MTILADIPNPGPQWDDYRALLSSIPPEIKSLMKEKIKENLSCSVRQLNNILDEISPLTHDQNLTIAWTEIARADVSVNFQSYCHRGVVVGKKWLLASHDNCPLCTQNAQAGPIGLNDFFPSGDAAPPAHSRCRCDILPVLKGEKVNIKQGDINKPKGATK